MLPSRYFSTHKNFPIYEKITEVASTMSVTFFLFASLLLRKVAKSQESPICSSIPGPELEIYYNYYNCSTVVDWSRFIPDDCREAAVAYEVQLMNGCKSVTSQNFTTKEMLGLIPGKCFGDTLTCYARFRAQLRDSSWSDYSHWIRLSSTYRMVQGKWLTFRQFITVTVMIDPITVCVVNSTEICLPVHERCSGDTLPTAFIINKQHYLPGASNHYLNITHNRICFKNLTESVYYISYCHETVCTIFSEEFTILQRTLIKVRTGKSLTWGSSIHCTDSVCVT